MATSSFPKSLLDRNALRTRCAIFIALVCSTLGCGAESSSGENTVDSKYEPGQVWTYHTREGEEASRLVILRLDSDPKLGSIVHVYIDGISIKNPHVASGVGTEIGHLPFSVEAIDESAIQQDGTRPLPNFQAGYTTWREAFDSGQGGVFTITVSEVVESMEQALNQSP